MGIPAARADAYCRLAVTEGRYRYEWLGRRCTGEKFWGEMLLTPVLMDTHTLLHAVWRDITPSKWLSSSDVRARKIVNGRWRRLG